MVFSSQEFGFHQRLGCLVNQLGHPQFWSLIARLLAENLRFDHWFVSIFRHKTIPISVSHDLSDEMQASLLRQYIQYFYQFDPFYQCSDQLSMPSLYRLDEVMPPTFYESDYYKNYFSLHVLQDEVQFLLPLSDSQVLSFSLVSACRFDDRELSTLQLFAPWLFALMKKNIEYDESHCVSASFFSHDSEAYLRQPQFGLTKREIEVALKLLNGESNKSIAKALGVSFETIRVHRRNLYTKLLISNQAQLFLLFSQQNALQHQIQGV